MLAPVAVAGAAFWSKLALILKFGWPLFKMGGLMFVSLWFYARIFGWPFAAGFIVMVFIHEMGHLLAARMVGLKVGLPMFIPFMGAMIALKEAPPNAWIESIVGIGGPILGSLGALAVGSCFLFTHQPIFLALAYTGFFLNLFNLIPIVPLDGGRIVAAISPWLWVLGLLIIVPYLMLRTSVGGFLNSGISFVILLIVLTSIPRVMALFRRKTPQQMRYYECTPTQRCVMALLYFSLLGSLYVGMGAAKRLLETGSF